MFRIFFFYNKVVIDYCNILGIIYSLKNNFVSSSGPLRSLPRPLVDPGTLSEKHRNKLMSLWYMIIMSLSQTSIWTVTKTKSDNRSWEVNANAYILELYFDYVKKARNFYGYRSHLKCHMRSRLTQGLKVPSYDHVVVRFKLNTFSKAHL